MTLEDEGQEPDAVPGSDLSGSQRPTIPIRHPSFALDRSIPKHWHGGDPFASHFFDALSSTFPAGESFFVRSVMHFKDQIEDPDLLVEIRAFAGQEGQHSRIHQDHVALLIDQGYTGLTRRNRFLDWALRWSNRHVPRYSLAVTGATEHLTSILARQLLMRPDRSLVHMHSEMAELWQWHALEEAEHKSVAFDVLQKATPKHWMRVLALAETSIGLSFEVLVRIVYMLWKDGLLLKAGVWRDGIRFLFGRGGFLRDCGREYRAWYRRDFHPEDANDSAMIEVTRPNVRGDLSQSA